MWFRRYRDYEIDKPLIKEQVSPGHGIIGCEMHELNGWGHIIHVPIKKKKGWFRKFISRLFKGHSQDG